MGPAQDADLGAAQAALRDAADPLSRLCHPGPDGDWSAHFLAEVLLVDATSSLQYPVALVPEVLPVLCCAWTGRSDVRDLRPACSECLHVYCCDAGHRPRELLGLMAAGVEALVAMWGAFERGWHAEWLALRAATPPADLNPKLCVPTPALVAEYLSTICSLLNTAAHSRAIAGWLEGCPDSPGEACV